MPKLEGQDRPVSGPDERRDAARSQENSKKQNIMKGKKEREKSVIREKETLTPSSYKIRRGVSKSLKSRPGANAPGDRGGGRTGGEKCHQFIE